MMLVKCCREGVGRPVLGDKLEFLFMLLHRRKKNKYTNKGNQRETNNKPICSAI